MRYFTLQNVETVERLVSNGINVNHRNKSGNLAIQHIDVSPGLITYLITAGLDIQAKDRSGNSFLCIPFERYVYDALTEAGCNLNHKNKNGQTAFDYWQSGNCHMAGANTQWGAIKDDYIRFLMRNIHLKDQSPLLFKHVTLKSLALMKLLTQKGIEFKINEKCIIGATIGNVKEVITTLKALTDISYIMFYTEYGFSLPRYAGKLLIKWLIRNDIKIDMRSLKERCIYDEISHYKSKREDNISSESKR